ncbi:hypothetical protein A2V61_03395 [Candidatus Woesebacteria bacterium RBG_19FT_COMBO_47_8]|uniref:Regulatory protein RecX n=1 Tax=Candidatus Woesebacteria bacterium RBG_13_46_13 TaxID=1802479 RepID=A0A1F7X5V3_9BACT|nr:MAG: hypothetical protein A2Y68_02485 [Candidatus Woesebacteria bacterium RBG_13_46_13]OGM16729.1 MAG: hypothetical protein A2V61_03395 [Candidatus Woesebacteria bacterium RBG_19FT_COMBO_47_8]HJX59133.1 RecX family transcriptional regulator [Patescibacteria group bacterium]
MPVITAVKPQRNKKRLNIYLDGKFGFGIDLENFLRLGLKVEEELSEEDIEEIVKKAEFQKTLDKLLRFATLRPRSEKEINYWFKKQKVHESIIPKLFERIKHLDLVDDEAFSGWWIEQRLTFKPKGVRALRQELRQKGIAKEIVDKVLAKTKIDEVGMAKELMQKKAYKWQNLPKREARLKMSQFLARKGFAWEVIEKVVEKR